MNKLTTYFQGVWAETKKVTWPTRKQVINHTTIVIVSVVIAMVIFGLIDLGLSKVLEFLIIKR